MIDQHHCVWVLLVMQPSFLWPARYFLVPKLFRSFAAAAFCNPGWRYERRWVLPGGQVIHLKFGAAVCESLLLWSVDFIMLPLYYLQDVIF
jgi:hypothetical protein